MQEQDKLLSVVISLVETLVLIVLFVVHRDQPPLPEVDGHIRPIDDDTFGPAEDSNK